MKLAAYLDESGKSVHVFAKEAGLDPATVFRLIAEDHEPQGATIRAVISASKGKVGAADLLGPPKKKRKRAA